MNNIAHLYPSLPSELYPNPVFGAEDDGVEYVQDFFYRGCPQGSLVETPDGRLWTVVYHNIDGYGVVAGDRPDLIGAADDRLPPPSHMLREKSSATRHSDPSKCLGGIVRVLRRAPKAGAAG